MTSPALCWRETLEGLAWTLENPEETRALYISVDASLTIDSLRSPTGPVVVPITGSVHASGIAEGASLVGRLVARPPGRLVYDGVFASSTRPSCRLAGEKHLFWLAPRATLTELQVSFYDDANREFARGLVRSTFATDPRHLLRTLRLTDVPGLSLLRSLLRQ